MEKPSLFLFIWRRVKLLIIGLVIFFIMWGLSPLVWDKIPKLNIQEIGIVVGITGFGLIALVIDAALDYKKIYGSK